MASFRFEDCFTSVERIKKLKDASEKRFNVGGNGGGNSKGNYKSGDVDKLSKFKGGNSKSPVFKDRTYVARIFNAEEIKSAATIYADTGAERNILTSDFVDRYRQHVQRTNSGRAADAEAVPIQFGAGQPVRPISVVNFGLMHGSQVLQRSQTTESTNLLSLSSLDDMGVKMLISGGKIHYFPPGTQLQDTADPIMTSTREGGLYATKPTDVLRAGAELTRSNPASTVASTVLAARCKTITNSERYSALSYHRALAHVGLDKLITMCKHSSAIGLTPKLVSKFRKAEQEEHRCLHCGIGAFPQFAVNSVSQNRSEHWKPGDYWHIDYVGKFPTSINGNTGVFIANDQGSALTEEEYTNSKEVRTAVLPYLQRFIDKVKTDGKVIKKLHFDSDTIFEDMFVRDFLCERHIAVGYSEPGEHRHSGSIERCAGTLQNLSRKSLKAARAEDKFWDSAFGHATYVTNRVLTARFRKDPSKAFKTPYEIYYGKKPDITKIAMYGAACVVRTPNPRQHLKLDDRGALGVIIGNSEEHNDGLVIYCLETKRVRISKDVIVDENRLGFTGDSADWFTGIAPNYEWHTAIPEFVFEPPAQTTPNPSTRAQQRTDTPGSRKPPKDRSPTGAPRLQEQSDSATPLLSQTSAPAHHNDRRSRRLAEIPAEANELPARKRRKRVRFSVTLNNIRSDQPYPTTDAENNGDSGDEPDDVDDSVSSSNHAQSPAAAARTAARATIPRRASLPAAPTAVARAAVLTSRLSSDLTTPIVAAPIVNQKRKKFKAKAREDGVPMTYAEAMSEPYRQYYEPAIREELESIFGNNTFGDPEPISSDASRVGLKWIFSVKRDSDGNIVRHKARLVAKGYSQVYGESFTETFAPTPGREALRILLTLAAKYRLQTFQGDVKTAFLYGDMDEEVYCDWIEGLPHIPAGHAIPLRKALYGTKQAARQWNKKLDAVMRSLGYTPCEPEDCCIYVKNTGNGKFVIIVVYVDDVFGAGNDTAEISRFNREIGKIFNYKNLGEITHALGMKVSRLPCGSIHLSNARYVHDILRHFDMEHCTPRATPADPKTKLTSVLPPQVGRETADLQKEYREVTGSLMHLMTTVRPDTSAAVSDLGRFMHLPGANHLRAAYRVLRYLQGSPDLGMTFRALPQDTPIRPILQAYSDANWAESEDRISTSGIIIRLIDESEADDEESWGDVIFYSSKKQDNVTLSSTEAEYVAACTCAVRLVWMRRLMQKLGFPQNDPTVIFDDNTGAIDLAEAPAIGARSKHIDVKYHKIRELIRDNIVRLVHCRTENMWADVMTKNTTRPIHHRHRTNMGVVNIEDVC